MTSVLDSVAVPSGWDLLPFGRLVERSKQAGRGDLQPLSVFLDNGVVLRASREDNFNRLGADMSKYLVVKPGDVVFNKLRTWQGGLGVSKYEGIVSPAYFVCRPKPGVDPRFLHYLLRSVPYLAELTRVSKFMPPSQFDILWDDLRLVPIVFPPSGQQRAIADFLDAETARIDALIARKSRLIDLLDEADRSTVDEIFSSSPMVATVRLARLATLQTGLTLDSARAAAATAITLPYLRVANVQADHLDLSEVKEVTVPVELARRTRLRAGDVLMTEGGDLDKLGRGTVWRSEIADCLHQNHVFAVRPNPSSLLPEFLAALTRTSRARRYFESTGTRSTNLASTNSSKVLDFRVPLLAIEEQRACLARYRRRADVLGRCRADLARQIELLAEHRQALIAAAVTGEIPLPGVAA